jgi:pimeloyl-ACP methyl ester carboxylesterase
VEPEVSTPLELLGMLARQDVALAPGLRHLEAYTREGLLTIMWHGPPDAEAVVVTCGGAMGSLLGPARGLYHDLGLLFADDGIATLRVGYRVPNDLHRCVVDVASAVQLAAEAGGDRFVVVGHSFGGAVAVQVGVALPDHVAGVVTLATQSAGCERAGGLAGRPLLLFHGDSDELLPPTCSEVVAAIAGTGEVVILEGTGHLMTQAAGELRERLLRWIPAVLARPSRSS